MTKRVYSDDTLGMFSLGEMERIQYGLEAGFVSLELEHQSLLPLLLKEARSRHADFSPGKIASGIHTSLRSDLRLWIDFQNTEERRLRDGLESLKSHLNRTLFLGLVDFEAHYSVYKPGTFYRPHLDRQRRDDRRVVSGVLYLNENWTENDRGELVVTSSQTAILPRLGTSVFWLSDEVEHEVKSPNRDRWSIALWFLRRG